MQDEFPPEDSRVTQLDPGMARRHVAETLYKAVQYAIGMGVQGDIIEFGTGSALSSTALAKSLANFSELYSFNETAHGIPPRLIHFYDSFEGFPAASNEVDANTLHIRTGVWGPGTAKGVSEQELAGMIGRYLPPERVRIVKGWYDHTLFTLQRGSRFSVVHLDCDFYGATFQVLDHLFSIDAISDGCTLLFDDWDCNAANRDVGQRRAFREIEQKHRVEWSDNGYYGLASRRVIIHRG